MIPAAAVWPDGGKSKENSADLEQITEGEKKKAMRELRKKQKKEKTPQFLMSFVGEGE